MPEHGKLQEKNSGQMLLTPGHLKTGKPHISFRQLIQQQLLIHRNIFYQNEKQN